MQGHHSNRQDETSAMRRTLEELGEIVVAHALKLEEQDKLIRSLTEHSVHHGAVLLQHAKLHTSHAEAMTALSASNDASCKSARETVDAVADMRASIDDLRKQIGGAERQKLLELVDVKSEMRKVTELQRKLAAQTDASGHAMRVLTSWHSHPILRFIGALIGTAVASYLAARGYVGR